ncbi:hypothetical protein LUZ63_002548 [Rhynchospora breviuscula]|uniref:TLC domain-containing protein n=1 Tax=Rhynchospora breviuscula TaxID=2022672 RepID=A0A9Q0D0B5_9POAL|nr:hypothetical protein LUZ63_002548 [Rhynchospora breviuscula]
MVSMMEVKSYRFQAEILMKDYLLADSFITYTSVLCGLLMCKMAYDMTHLVSSLYYKKYASLTKLQKIEWNNRGMSSIHAVFITIMSLYLVFISDLFSDQLVGPVTIRSSNLSTFALGGLLSSFLAFPFKVNQLLCLIWQVSTGYFLTDLAMILWLYPYLGGMEYVLHHLLSSVALAYSMLSGEGQLYIYMTLLCETTTPGVNLRWYLDTAGLKRSKAYVLNGVAMFVAWLVARILLFIYLFYHIYKHHDQICMLHPFGYFLSLTIPVILFAMNLTWFMKILRGLKKTLTKKQAKQQ